MRRDQLCDRTSALANARDDHPGRSVEACLRLRRSILLRTTATSLNAPRTEPMSGAK